MYTDPTTEQIEAQRARLEAFKDRIEAAKAEILDPAPSNTINIRSFLDARLTKYIVGLEPALAEAEDAIKNGEKIHIDADTALIISDFEGSSIYSAHAKIMAFAGSGQEAYDAGIERFKTRYAALFDAAANQNDETPKDASPTSDTGHYQPASAARGTPVLGRK